MGSVDAWEIMQVEVVMNEASLEQEILEFAESRGPTAAGWDRPQEPLCGLGYRVGTGRAAPSRQ